MKVWRGKRAASEMCTFLHGMALSTAGQRAPRAARTPRKPADLLTLRANAPETEVRYARCTARRSELADAALCAARAVARSAGTSSSATCWSALVHSVLSLPIAAQTLPFNWARPRRIFSPVSLATIWPRTHTPPSLPLSPRARRGAPRRPAQRSSRRLASRASTRGARARRT